MDIILEVIALLAMGILGIAFIGVVFFKAKPILIAMAGVFSVAILFITSISFVTIIGGAVAVIVLWNFRILKSKPLILAILIIGGLTTMLLGTQLVLIPTGLMP